jgi:hypothetical protein
MGKFRARTRAMRIRSEDVRGTAQVAIQVDEPAVRDNPAADAPLEDLGFADLALAGAALAGEFRCADCGYGAVIHRILPLCPMCGGTVWESRTPHFSR